MLQKKAVIRPLLSKYRHDRKKSTVYAGQYTLDFSLAHGTVRERPIKKFHIRSLVFFKPVFLQAAFWEIINLTGWTSWSRQLLTGSKQHNNTETGNMQLAVTALKKYKAGMVVIVLGQSWKKTEENFIITVERTSKKKKKTTLGKYLEKQGAQIRLVFFYVYFIVLMIKFISSVPMI